MIRAILTSVSAGMLLVACTPAPGADGAADTSPISAENPVSTENPINTENMSETVKVLASDEYMGRAPGTEGETKTVAYLIERFKELGLEPGGRDGKWTDPVTLKHSVVNDIRTLSFDLGETAIPLKQGLDINISSPNPREDIAMKDVPVVFVGFGASAPERDWRGCSCLHRLAECLVSLALQIPHDLREQLGVRSLRLSFFRQPRGQ